MRRESAAVLTRRVRFQKAAASAAEHRSSLETISTEVLWCSAARDVSSALGGDPLRRGTIELYLVEAGGNV